MSLAFLNDSPETIHKKEQLIFNAEEPLENSIESTTQESARSSSSEYILVDKVYAIEAGSDNITYNRNLYFIKGYTYYIDIEITSPHNCSFDLKMWDPDGVEYNIFHDDLFFDPEYGRSVSIPFGAALTGYYFLNISTSSQESLTVHVKIERGSQCLHDKMNAQDIENVVLLEVVNFSLGYDKIEYEKKLEMDTMYKFYIGRVSSISINFDSEVRISFSIITSGDTYSIFSNVYLAGVGEVNKTYFGTPDIGDYTMKLELLSKDSDVERVNVGFVIVEDHAIGDSVNATVNEESDGEDENEAKESDASGTNETGDLEEIWNVTASMPVEYSLGTILATGGTVGTTAMMVIFNKRKNTVKLNLGKKK